MISKGPVLTLILKSIPYPNTLFFFFFGGGGCKFLQILKICKRKGFSKFNICLLKSHHRSYSFCCLFMWGSLMYRQNTHSQNAFFGGKILQNLKKTHKKDDFWFKMSLSKFLHRIHTILVIVKLQGPIEVAYSTAGATKTLGFLHRNLTLAPKETKVAAYKAMSVPN